MLNHEFSTSGWQALEQGIQLLALRQRLLSNNIANANTPGYKRSDIEFTGVMKQFLNDDNGRLVDGRTLVRKDTRTSMKPDGNNVDIDIEMVLLAENNLAYQAAIRQLNFRLNNLRMAISEGRKG